MPSLARSQKLQEHVWEWGGALAPGTSLRLEVHVLAACFKGQQPKSESLSWLCFWSVWIQALLVTMRFLSKSRTWLSNFHFTLKCNGLSHTLSWSFTHDFCNIDYYTLYIDYLENTSCGSSNVGTLQHKSSLTSPLILSQKPSSVGSYLAHGGRYKFLKIWKFQFYH